MMRYSEAIRLGGMMSPKAKGVFYNPYNEGMCAAGAALSAIGQLDPDRSYDDFAPLEKAWPILAKTNISESDIPDLVKDRMIDYYHIKKFTILHLSVNLNDGTDWTREQIADWVAQMEVKYGLVPVEGDETVSVQPDEVKEEVRV